MPTLVLISLVLAAAGLVQAGLMLLHGWEHRRYHARRLASPLKPDSGLLATVIAPCKGLDPDLKANFGALFRQCYPRYDLCFVVESESDPAVPVIHELAAENPQVESRVVIAGRAENCGQKVWNLMRAAEAVLGGTSGPPGTGDFEPDLSAARWASRGSTHPTHARDVEIKAAGPQSHDFGYDEAPQSHDFGYPTDILAFVDSDAAPHPDWLARLVERLAGGKHAIATGYRWYAPVKNTWPNRLLSAINNTIIAVMGPHGFNLVWGGSWAIRAETFRELGLPGAWRGSISDDLVVSRLVRAAGLRVAYEPHCLVRSAADFSWVGLVEFLRRQFTIVRVYSPLWWHFAFWTGLFTNLALLGVLVLGCALALIRESWQLPLAAAVVYYLAGALRAHWASRAVRPFIAVSDAEYEAVARVNVWCWPLVSLSSWLAIASAAFGRTVVWRGIGYRLDSPSRTTLLNQTALNQPAGSHRRTSDARTATRAA